MLEGAMQSAVYGLSANVQTLKSWLRHAEDQRDAAYRNIRIANKRIMELADQRNEFNANAQARNAQVNALLVELTRLDPNNHLLQNTSRTYKGKEYHGQPKTKLRVIFEDKYDSFLRGIGIVNPESKRTD